MRPILKNVKRKKRTSEEEKEEEIPINKISKEMFYTIWIDTVEYG